MLHYKYGYGSIQISEKIMKSSGKLVHEAIVNKQKMLKDSYVDNKRSESGSFKREQLHMLSQMMRKKMLLTFSQIRFSWHGWKHNIGLPV